MNLAEPEKTGVMPASALTGNHVGANTRPLLPEYAGRAHVSLPELEEPAIP